MEELEAEMGNQAEFQIVDVTKDYSLADKYGITATPTFVILTPGGAVSQTLVGGRQKSEIQAALQKAT